MIYDKNFPNGNKIYYNASLSNNNTDTADPIYAIYDKTSTNPIILKASDHYFTIPRFSINANDVPLTIFYIQNGSITNTFFKWTLSYDGSDYTAFTQYSPELLNLQTPTSFDANNPYFWIYSYLHQLSLFNNTLSTLMGQLNAAKVTSFADPYFVYENGYVSLIVDNTYVVGDGQIYINKLGSNLFEGFPLFYDQAGTVSADDKYGKFNLLFTGINGFNNFGVAATSPPAFIRITEEYKQYVASSSSFKTIAFTTSSLPVTTEIFGEANNDNSQGYKNIITDFEPLIEEPGAQRSIMNFSQSGPYRLIDLNGDNPIYRIQFQIWWVDKQNIFHPLYLEKFGYFDVKIEFIKKSTFTS